MTLVVTANYEPQGHEPQPLDWFFLQAWRQLAGLPEEPPRPQRPSLDALKNIVWNDDSQVVDHHLYKRFGEHYETLVVVKEKV